MPSFPVKVIGYSDEIEKLMQSANVMISKLGGLTTYEALACGLPIIADATTRPMPQEAGTVQMLSDRGAGIMLKKSTDIVPTIRNLIGNSPQYTAMKAATAGMTMPNSTEYIIREINALLPHYDAPPPKPRPFAKAILFPPAFCQLVSFFHSLPFSLPPFYYP